MVDVVESTISLALEVGEDFKAVATAVQANLMVVLLDSDCSYHLMGMKEAFVEMKPGGDVKHVCGFNGALQNVEGRGTVALRGETGKPILIPDILYVPGVQANLLSAGQLKDNSNSRSALADVVALRTIASATKSTPDMWHARLVHVGIDTIKSLAKHEVAVGLDIKQSTAPDLPCASCVEGNLAWHTFPKQGSDAENALDVVHIYLCGPFRVAANDGSLYFLLLKDRKTRYMWVQPIAKKSDALVIFEMWLKLVGRKTLKTKKMLLLTTEGSSSKPSTTGERHAEEPAEEPAEEQSAEEHAEVKSAEEPTAKEKSAEESAEAKSAEEPTAEDQLDDDLSYHACLPSTSYSTLLDDADADVDLPELDPEMHADPEHRWDTATMTVKEALASMKGKAVKATMDEEIKSLITNGTWELVERPCGVNIMKNRWVLMTKYHIEKDRLVVKGFTQVNGADYDETYAPVGSYVTLRIFLSIKEVHDLHLMQLDMKNAFLQSKLDRLLYMYQPDYYIGTGRVGKLLKSLYRLKQSPLLWYKALNDVMSGADWKKSQVDEALYFKVGVDKLTCWVLVYRQPARCQQ
ncbi:unnamed protein product [Closterium sp. NIES-53]